MTDTTQTPTQARALAQLATTRSTVVQWFGVLAGPLAMLVNLQVEYALVPWACTRRAELMLNVTPVVLLLVVAVAIVLAHREWRIARPRTADAERATLARARFLGLLGMGTAAFFGVVILAMWAANAFLDTCHGS
jgi:hypothetical protein